MYHQIQSYATPFLWWQRNGKGLFDNANANLSLSSLVSAQPFSRSITEDFPPTATVALQSVNVNNSGADIRSVVEDFPPNASLSLQSVFVIQPILRGITENFPPTVSVALQSVVVITPVTEVLPAEAANAAVSLQSVVSV